MKSIQNRHMQLELETWLRTLDHIQEENVFLKNHLADVIRNDIAQSTLEESERFQSLFIDKDRLIVLIRYDIAKQRKCIEAEMQVNRAPECMKGQNRLRVDMRKLEEKFCSLKVRFSRFMAKNL